MSEHWYRIALADRDGTRLVVAPGEHLGIAIEAARLRATRGDEAWPIGVERAPEGEVPLGEAVGKGVVVERDAPTGLPTFRWPTGVVPSLEGARELGTPAEGYLRTRHGDVHALEAMVAGDRLIEVFMEVVELLPAADNVEVRVTGQHDGEGKAEVWLTPRMADVRRAIRFLDDHDDELLGNGHVEIAVYLRKQKSTLRMTEHKTLIWLTEDAGLADTFGGWMAARDVPARETLPLISSVEHHHWRSPKTKSRKKLLQHLHRLRLRRVDSWEDAA
jgi:hypothetical protein